MLALSAQGRTTRLEKIAIPRPARPAPPATSIRPRRRGHRPARRSKPLCHAPFAAFLRALTPRKINQITAALLLLGFGSALVLYLRAKPLFVDPLIGNPLTSKKYLHELRLMGGKANVVFAKFMAWFTEIWQGENLAVTVAVLTVALTLAFRFVAAHPELFLPDSLPAPEPSKPSPDPTKASP